MRLVGRLVCSGALALACAHAPRAPTQPAPGDSYRLAEVPFFSDDTDQCGPAVLAEVLTFWGAPTAPQNVRDEVYMSALGGSLPIDLVQAAEARGFRATLERGTVETIKGELRAGHPVIALLELGFLRSAHFVLLTGYEDGRGGFFAHSGEQQNEFWSYGRFARGWDRAGNWLLLVQPLPGQRSVPRPDVGCIPSINRAILGWCR